MLGLDGTEIKTEAKYKTFCNLCTRLINKNEEVYTWEGHKFFIHINCKSEEVRTRMTNIEFRRNVKKKSSKKRITAKR